MNVVGLFRLGVIFIVLVLCFASKYIVEADLDYFLVILTSLVGGLTFFILKDKRVLYIDAGWSVCFVVAVVYIVVDLVDGGDVKLVVMQSLVFIIPLSMYIARAANIEVTESSLLKAILIMAVCHVPVFILSADEIHFALTSNFERARFHTYTSISITFPIFAGLLYLKMGVAARSFLLFALALFCVVAEHRSLYVAFALQLLLWVFSSHGMRSICNVKSIFTFLCLFIIVLAASSYFGVAQKLYMIFNSAVDGADGNTNSRLALAANLLGDIHNNLLGTGFGEVYKYGLTSRDEYVYYALHHNSFLTPFYFLGVLPGIAFLVSASLIVFRYRHRNRVLCVCQSALAGMCCFALFNLWFEHPVYALSYWLLFGLYSSLVRQQTYGKIFDS